MDVDDYGRMAITGSSLGEVFAVFIKPHAGECEIYGEIQVNDDEGTIYFYDLEPENSLTISSSSPSQSLLLSNSDRAILACRQFIVNLDLKEKNGGNEFIRGSFSWNAAKDGRYDVVLDKNIEGKLGSATVYYTVHRIALEATIGAEFVLGETMNSGMHVHGKFVARYKDRFHFNGKDLEGRHEFTLFEGRLADVKDGDIFPLNRAVVTLPCYTSLVIGVQLKSSEDDQILWDGEVEFPTIDITFNTIHQDIQGTCGHVIRVGVYAFDYIDYGFEGVESLKNSMRKAGIFPKCVGADYSLPQPQKRQKKSFHD